MKLKFFALGLLTLLLSVVASAQNKGFIDPEESDEKKPWTDKPFYNDPNNFQFAIISDRTGGHREGVFGKGLEKINQLYPEFVMSVGDLIEGYTKDTTVINAQWNEFNGILDSLRTKFFYVAGNHDYSNQTMAKKWKERYGKDYYHFIYKNVLFLVINSNDADGIQMENDQMTKDQIEFLKEAISQNQNVRWTMVFMHHPMWGNGEFNGFSEVEAALKGRNYTVFAGHKHRYLHEVRNDQNHYVLATTGGGSKLRGAKFGEFDHISWVTMTDEGPKLVNLALSGILDHDVSNGVSSELARSLIKSTDFKPLVLYKGDQRKVILSINNPSDRPVHFRSRLYHHHRVIPDTSRFNLEVPSNSTRQLVIMTKPKGYFESTDWGPLELEWEIEYKNDFMEPEFSLSGTEVIELNSLNTNLSITDQNIFLEDLEVELTNPYHGLAAKYTLDDTDPTSQNSVFPQSLILEDDSEIRVSLFDSMGFKSGVLTRAYQKVSPLPSFKPKSVEKGYSYTYYEGNFTVLPDFENLTPISQGVTMDLAPDKLSNRLDHYAIQYKGYINIPVSGLYTFYLTSDDGSKLFIDDYLVIDNDGSHVTTTKQGMLALKKGWHKVQIDYFEDFLGERLELQYSGDEVERSDVELWH